MKFLLWFSQGSSQADLGQPAWIVKWGSGFVVAGDNRVYVGNNGEPLGSHSVVLGVSRAARCGAGVGEWLGMADTQYWA